uniref:Uncharacterized protein n=1 Tax=Solanum lycopersicum TaxID=4081 RepID=A0A3Q7G6U1_SOLLC
GSNPIIPTYSSPLGSNEGSIEVVKLDIRDFLRNVLRENLIKLDNVWPSLVRKSLPFPSNYPASPGSSTVRAPFPPYDLFGSSSPDNSEAGLNQSAPDSPNPCEPASPPIAEPYHPLQEDGERLRELAGHKGASQPRDDSF